MIDKISGKVSYAVLSFGGFLGIGDDHYPLPWQSLKYDTSLGGYRHRHHRDPTRRRAEIRQRQRLELGRPARTRSVNDYYGVAIYLDAIRHRKARHHGGPFLSIRRPLPAGPIVGREQRRAPAMGKFYLFIIAISIAILLATSAYIISLLIPSCLRTAAALLPTLSITF